MHGNAAALAYQKTAQITANPRELEAQLLTRAAAKLVVVQANWASAETELGAALTYNRRLWTVLATNATAVDNPMPEQLKQTIANLAIFIFRRTFDIMLKPAPEMLDPLISINRHLAAGLRGS